MSKVHSRVGEAFRGAGLRATPQRYAVLDYLARRKVHATAEEIAREVNRTDPRASRATVYNSLHALVRAGLVREVVSEGHAARFDAAIERHHHFVCECCGAIDDIAWFDLPVGAGRASIGARKIRDYEVVFRGTCDKCARSAHGGSK